MTTIKSTILGIHKNCGGKVILDKFGHMLSNIHCSNCACTSAAGNLPKTAIEPLAAPDEIKDQADFITKHNETPPDGSED